MKSSQMDKAQALDFLGLRIMKYAGITHVVTQFFVEVTEADADQAIAECLEAITLAEQSPLAGAELWYVKAISAWTVVKNLLKTEEN